MDHCRCCSGRSNRPLLL